MEWDCVFCCFLHPKAYTRKYENWHERRHAGIAIQATMLLATTFVIILFFFFYIFLPGALAYYLQRLQHRNTCNATPPAKFKMNIRGA